MATDALTLQYGADPIKVHVYGKQASGTLNGTITGITFTVTGTGAAAVSIQPAGNNQEFLVSNINPTLGGNGIIAWSATNELGNAVTGNESFTLVPADPAVALEIKIIP